MNVNELAEYLRGEGVEVRWVLNQTTNRPEHPREEDVVAAMGLELGNDLDIFVANDGTVCLSWWIPDEKELVQIGEYAPGEMDDLVKAIRQATR
jgi:hypothetical protein